MGQVGRTVYHQPLELAALAAQAAGLPAPVITAQLQAISGPFAPPSQAAPGPFAPPIQAAPGPFAPPLQQALGTPGVQAYPPLGNYPAASELPPSYTEAIQQGAKRTCICLSVCVRACMRACVCVTVAICMCGYACVYVCSFSSVHLDSCHRLLYSVRRILCCAVASEI